MDLVPVFSRSNFKRVDTDQPSSCFMCHTDQTKVCQAHILEYFFIFKHVKFRTLNISKFASECNKVNEMRQI